jgi:hypothetical protein
VPSCIHGVQNHKATVVNPAIRRLERAAIAWLQWPAGNISLQVEGTRRWQQFSAAQVIIQKEPEAKQPGRSLAIMVGKDEPQGPDDVGRKVPEYLAFDQCLADEPKLVVLKIPQTTVESAWSTMTMSRWRGHSVRTDTHCGRGLPHRARYRNH